MKLFIALAACCWASAILAADLTVVTFNTESDNDTAPSLVATQIRELGDLDILAVQEAESTAALSLYANALAETLGGRWRYVVSESGHNVSRQDDLLGIIYNTKKFRQIATTEYHMVRSADGGDTYGTPRWSLRGVLFLRLLHYDTGKEFRIGTLHLKCCGEGVDIRAHQAELLARELKQSNLPTFLLGDSNMPIDPATNMPVSGNEETFVQLTTEANLTWVQPSNPMATQCSSNPNHQSMLDQIFVSDDAAASATSEILFPEATYCANDPNGFADHRPVKAIVSNFFDGVPAGGVHAVAAWNIDTTDIDFIEEQAQTLSRPGDFVGDR